MASSGSGSGAHRGHRPQCDCSACSTLSPSLYSSIDHVRIVCLNEALEGTGRDVFKPHSDALDRSKVRVFLLRNSSLIELHFVNNFERNADFVTLIHVHEYYRWFLVCR